MSGGVSGCECPLVSEDIFHPTLECVLSVPVSRRTCFPSADNLRFDFRRANYPGLYDCLQGMDWSGLIDCGGVNAVFDFFYEKLYGALTGLSL